MVTAPATRLTEVKSRVKTKLELHVHLRLASCRNLMMREMRRCVEHWNLTLPQFDVLAELTRAPDEGFTFVELSRLLLVTSGNLTGIIDRLEADRLVRRQPDRRDRRVIRLGLTDKGWKLTDRMLPRHVEDVQEMLSFMPRDQLAALNDLLGKLRDGLHARARARAEQ